MSLAVALRDLNEERGRPLDLRILLNSAFPEGAADVAAAFSGSSQSVAITSFSPDGVGHEVGPLMQRAATLGIVAAVAARALKPDAIHVASVFEGFEEGAALGSYPSAIVPDAFRTATVYDVIPLLFPERYLTNPGHQQWYRNAVAAVSSYDLLFAISEATRRDVIERLGVKPDRVINISAAVDAAFRPLPDGESHRARIAQTYGLVRPFVLYTGGADPRKNLEGAIDAFARLAPDLRRIYQFAIVCKVDDQTRARLGSRALKAGLEEGDLLMTGYVPDDDLVILYNLATLFVFPSLYEGFGLPVLEALSCGTPTLVGNNSSLPDIVGRDDMLFDAERPEAIATAMERLLRDEDTRRDFSRYGIERARLFSWRVCAERMLDALVESLDRRDAKMPASRPRVALLSPLPPARSGISDYTADLLEHLERHMDVELFLDAESLNSQSASVRPAFPWQDLAARHRDYDSVIYQVGNSMFHAHMLDLLPKTGGVLVLHDVYLSNLKSWLDMHEGRPGLFRAELAASHGPSAIATLDDFGHDGAIRDWPASRPELAAADSVIVNSQFAARLIAAFHPELAGKVTVIRLPQAVSPEATEEGSDAARQRLGIAKDTLLVVSVGLINAPKRLDAVFEAFLLLADRFPQAELVLVGNTAPDDRWSNALHQRMKRSGGRARITGHVSSDDFSDYCRAADVAIQLRGSTRGETSAAVLRLLAHGAPVMVNAFGDFADYPADILVKLSENPDVVEISQALGELLGATKATRRALGNKARDFVRAHHSPDITAEAYARVVRQTIRHGSDTAALEAVVEALGQTIEGRKDILSAAEGAAGSLERSSPMLVARLSTQRRLLIDVSHTHNLGLTTGIQRVVRELTYSAYAKSGADGLNVQAFVRYADGRFETADGFALTLDGVSPPAGLDGPLTVRPGDALLMLDSSWFEYEAFSPLFEAVRDAKGSIHTCVFDLVPLKHPELTGEELPPVFAKWLARAAIESDSLLCISRAIADEVVDHLRDNRIECRPGLKVDWFHLGSDLPTKGSIGDATRKAFSGEADVILMVGTVEVRKRHDFALTVMEQLWEEGSEARFVIMGKEGWHVERLTQRLRRHRELGKRLIWIENPSDADISHAYSQAGVLLFPSLYEGYGLPLAESLRAGLPVVATDIPVLREVGGDAARYVGLDDLDGWVEAITHSLTAGRLAEGSGVIMTWSQSAAQMRATLTGARTYKRV